MRFINRHVGTVCVLSTAVALWGCSSSSAPGTSHPIVGTGATTSQPVTSAGGTVTLQGSSITIPPGAISGNQTITIQSTTTTAPTGVTNLSPIYQFGPPGLVFNKPVTIQLQFTSNGNTPAFAWTNPGSTTFGILPSTVSGSTLSGQVTHFSEGFVADGTTTSNLATGSEDAGPPTTDDAAVTPPSEDGGASVPDATTGAADATTSSGGGEDGGLGSGEDSGASAGHDGGTVGTSDSGSSGGDGSACAVCANGFCEGTCPAGSQTCGGTTCVATDTDPANCGHCGTTCPTGDLCVGGSCVPGCAESAGGDGCGVAPQPDGGVDCSSCGTGYVACGTSCTQTSSDPNNCGTCGTVCAAGQECSSGSCVSLCPGSDVCAGGACLSACPSGEKVCVSPASGATGFCTNTQTDPSNCGACGTSCQDGQSCVGGSCVDPCNSSSGITGCGAPSQPDGGIDCASSCGPSYVQCGSYCTDTDTDPTNCGACGTSCGAGATCNAGACTPVCSGGAVCTAFGTCAASCPSGEQVCNAVTTGGTSTCTVLSSDSNNCGTCGKACGSGEACIGGACVGTCGGGFAADAGVGGGADGGSSGGGGGTPGGDGGIGGGSGSDSGVSSGGGEDSGVSSGGGKDSGASSGGGDDSGVSGGGEDSGVSYGVSCTNVGGSDPACTGAFDLCEDDPKYGSKPVCVMPCSYPDGGTGYVNDPTGCPAPSAGVCAPAGFCP